MLRGVDVIWVFSHRPHPFSFFQKRLARHSKNHAGRSGAWATNVVGLFAPPPSTQDKGKGGRAMLLGVVAGHADSSLEGAGARRGADDLEDGCVIACCEGPG